MPLAEIEGMKISATGSSAVLLLCLSLSTPIVFAQSQEKKAAPKRPTATPVNDVSRSALALQVALDRAGFSPGEIARNRRSRAARSHRATKARPDSTPWPIR
jgi:hypothetical protein